MKRKINLNSLALQYLIGLVVNIVFVLILLSTDVSYRNLQLPEGEYQDNLWKGGDTISYVGPARNYLEYGVIGQGNVPDHARTIGYPLYLAVLMRLFGNNWLIWSFFIQATLYACVYPALSKIIQTLFPGKNSLIVPAFCFYLVSGAYFARTPVVLTDTFFAVLFTIGLCFGLLSIASQNWKYLIVQLVFIGYAAQVRPTLILYPIVNVFVLWLVARRHDVSDKAKVKAMVITSSVVLLLACSAPSIRNYVHYGFFKPTTKVESAFFNYLAKDVMTEKGELIVYEQMSQKTQEADDIFETLRLKRKFTADIYIKYPLTVLKRMAINYRSVLLSSHWRNIGYYWGYNWRDRYSSVYVSLKKSNFMLVVVVIWCMIYATIYVFFLYFLFLLVRGKDWLFLFTILLLVSPFLVAGSLVPAEQRMRLPIEGIIVMCAFYAISRIKYLNTTKPD